MRDKHTNYSKKRGKKDDPRVVLTQPTNQRSHKATRKRHRRQVKTNHAIAPGRREKGKMEFITNQLIAIPRIREQRASFMKCSYAQICSQGLPKKMFISDSVYKSDKIDKIIFTFNTNAKIVILFSRPVKYFPFLFVYNYIYCSLCSSPSCCRYFSKFWVFYHVQGLIWVFWLWGQPFVNLMQ